eukprot:362741-Chlamydomonas_euryale.AAC.1
MTGADATLAASASAVAAASAPTPAVAAAAAVTLTPAAAVAAALRRRCGCMLVSREAAAGLAATATAAAAAAVRYYDCQRRRCRGGRQRRQRLAHGGAKKAAGRNRGFGGSCHARVSPDATTAIAVAVAPEQPCPSGAATARGLAHRGSKRVGALQATAAAATAARAGTAFAAAARALVGLRPQPCKHDWIHYTRAGCACLSMQLLQHQQAKVLNCGHAAAVAPAGEASGLRACTSCSASRPGSNVYGTVLLHVRMHR